MIFIKFKKYNDFILFKSIIFGSNERLKYGKNDINT